MVCDQLSRSTRPQLRIVLRLPLVTNQDFQKARRSIENARNARGHSIAIEVHFQLKRTLTSVHLQLRAESKECPLNQQRLAESSRAADGGLMVSGSRETFWKPDEKWRDAKCHEQPLPGVMCVPCVEHECDARSKRYQQEIRAGEIAVQSMAPCRVDEAGNVHYGAGGGAWQQKCRDLHRAEESGRGDSSRYDPQGDYVQRLANAVAALEVTHGVTHNTWLVAGSGGISPSHTNRIRSSLRPEVSRPCGTTRTRRRTCRHWSALFLSWRDRKRGTLACSSERRSRRSTRRSHSLQHSIHAERGERSAKGRLPTHRPAPPNTRA